MINQHKIAMVGATGAVGEVVLQLLAQRNFPAEQLFLVASQQSHGKTCDYQGKRLTITGIDHFDFSQVSVAIFSVGKDIAKAFAPKAVKAGCFVVDNSSAFRYEEEIPLIVPEVNGHLLKTTASRIIANPNCSTIQMVVAIKPIYDAVGIETINVSTYQAVSGQGKEAIAELKAQTENALVGKPMVCTHFSKRMAFNVLPEIDVRQDNGYTFEEMKMVWETRKIMQDPQLRVNPTAVRVPVINGHSESIHLQTRRPITAGYACELLKNAPGVKFIPYDHQGEFPTPALDADGENAVYVGRVRASLAYNHGVNLWVVSDNLRKGAALNALQIIEQWSSYSCEIKNSESMIER